jgi:hypothetical protein
VLQVVIVSLGTGMVGYGGAHLGVLFTPLVAVWTKVAVTMTLEAYNGLVKLAAGTAVVDSSLVAWACVAATYAFLWRVNSDA